MPEDNDTKRRRIQPEESTAMSASWFTRTALGQMSRLSLEDSDVLESSFGTRDRVILKDSTCVNLCDFSIYSPSGKRTGNLVRCRSGSDEPKIASLISKDSFNGRCVYLNRLHDAPESPNTVSFADLVGSPAEIEAILLSSFGTDLNWLISELGFEVPITLVDDPQMVGSEYPRNVTIVYPSFNRREHPVFRHGTMHAKLMLIRFKNFNKLRIVISSANLIPFDWDSITQTIWVCDIDRSSPGNSQGTFGSDLTDFVHQLLPRDCEWNSVMSSWAVAINHTVPQEVSLIASVPGSYSGPALSKYGLMRLKDVVKDCPQSNVVQYQMSSIGSLYTQFKSDFCDAVNTRDLRLVFPTFDDAMNIRGKEHVFLSQRNAKSIRTLLTPLIRSPARIHVLNHSKCIHADAWIYFGSHNMSMPAWGRFDAERKIFSIASFELGIVVKKSPSMTLNIPWDIQSDPQPMHADPWMHDLMFHEIMSKDIVSGRDEGEDIDEDNRAVPGAIQFIESNNIQLVCLDIDGTIVESNTCSEILPAAANFLKRIDPSKIKVALVTNQGAVGLRYWMETAKFGEPSSLPSREEVESRIEKIRNQVREILGGQPVALFAAYRYQSKGNKEGKTPRWGPVPTAEKDDLRWSQEWRKPGPGMVREAMKWAKISPLVGLKNVLMVGDMESDEAAAKAAGVRFAKAPDFFKQ